MRILYCIKNAQNIFVPSNYTVWWHRHCIQCHICHILFAIFSFVFRISTKALHFLVQHFSFQSSFWSWLLFLIFVLCLFLFTSFSRFCLCLFPCQDMITPSVYQNAAFLWCLNLNWFFWDLAHVEVSDWNIYAWPCGNKRWWKSRQASKKNLQGGCWSNGLRWFLNAVRDMCRMISKCF